MEDTKMLAYIKDVLENMPADWFRLTTHRLDVYNEKLAKTEFIEQFETLYNANDSSAAALSELPTAYDYIRLGHPLSCVLEWVVANLNKLDSQSVISFSSKTIPVIAILRKNLLDGKSTRIVYSGDLPEMFDAEALKSVYGFNFDLKKVDDIADLGNDPYSGSTVFVSYTDNLDSFTLSPNIDFHIGLHPNLGSIILVNGEENSSYISEIQHVRRRETIAMTPANSLDALKLIVDKDRVHTINSDVEGNKQKVHTTIKEITHASTKPVVASSGLSMQYAIMMGLIDHAQENYPGKAIRFVVPPNCYGGTNDQARRVAATLNNVSIVDLPVDGDNDMVSSTNQVLDQIAAADAIPYIIAEIPTNPRVEVPELIKLKEALSKERKTTSGETAIDPVFILDQTFCPNVNFLGEGQILSSVRTIAYVSGSKFPSGGHCTAGYCVGNSLTTALIDKIDKHLILCDNRARNLQMEVLAKQLPSMIQRIADAYKNTREFVNFIQETLPTAKINFVSEELAEQGFTPSVFSLDLPTKGENDEEREQYKRALNLKLINMMITEIPHESKYCVSYGQLKGCYWTIPATSTQGTTKEGDKDYIARVAVSPDLDLELHKKVFADFVAEI
ncbi:MAG: cystathionine beta-synthase [Crocinitomicaceae bacterium]